LLARRPRAKINRFDRNGISELRRGAELRDRQSIAAAVGAIEAAIRTRSSRRELHEPAVARNTAGTVGEVSSLAG
jgi:hypothetical protein